MLRIVLSFIVLQGVLMSATLRHIDINGTRIPVIFEQSDYLPIASLQLIFTDAGHLSNRIDGQADMSARLLNEGTKRDGSVAFAKKLDDRAIELHASVGRETFVIELSALKSEFDYGVSLLLDLLRDPNYTDKAFSHIKRQKIGWLMQKKSDFDYVAATHLRHLLFDDTPIGKPYDGTLQSIEAMKLDDLKRFISDRLGRNNLIVVAGGAVDFATIHSVLQDLFNLLPDVNVTPQPYVRASDANRTQTIQEDTQQAYIYFGAPFDYRYDAKDQYKAKIAEYVLGGAGFGSRLMEELRVKRGLTYGAYSMLRRTRYASYLSGYLQTKLATQDEAIQTVKHVVRDFVAKGITQDELDAAKQFLVGSEPLRLETLSQRLHRAFDEYYYGRPLGFTKAQLQKIQRATLDEINDFIKSHPEIADLSFAVVTRSQPSPKQ